MGDSDGEEQLVEDDVAQVMGDSELAVSTAPDMEGKLKPEMLMASQ